MSKKQMGFTLIEIVMVLVLLGILSAVAVPKYFDLRDQAAQKTAEAAVAEIQARVNAVFAKELLNGSKGCVDARSAIFGTDNLAKIKSLGTNFDDDAFEMPKPSDEKATSTSIKFKLSGVEYSSAGTGLQKVNAITLPVCDNSAARN